ncbi:MAG: NifU family protein [Melioribacter sp.]|uniref:NifU family protein n=1 Tax=Rosettibacter primus TaxID=3111523 RepID=UPI00247CBF0E|nr:NifU family protein [Melioribacter sp.]
MSDTLKNDTLKEKVEKALETIRPYLKADGGDVELVNVTPEGIVEVKLTGACIDCPMSQMTLRAGVERALIREVPGIRRVEAVS